MNPVALHRRTQWVFALLALALVALLGRLFDLQWLRAETYQQRARSQQVSRPRLVARRGQILDRNGNVFAMSTTRPVVWADPSLVRDVAATAAALQPHLNVKPAVLLRQLGNTKRKFVWLDKQLSDAQASEVRILQKKGRVRGVFVDELPQRVYPKGELLGSVLGLCNEQGDGAEGIELQANALLRGTDGYLMAQRDNLHRLYLDPLFVGSDKILEPSNGHKIYLTIDEYLQHITEQELAKAANEYQPQRALAIVMEPATGQILALAQWPFFNPNVRSNYVAGAHKNFAVTEIFEPGSTMKAVAGAIALHEGRVTLDTPINCENGAWEHCPGFVLHDDHPLGTIPFRDVIRYSSNIGIAKAVRDVPQAQYYTYLLRFGFGRRTGIMLFPSESPGMLQPPRAWSRLSMASLPMGHEIGVTALQLVSAMATIANGGTRVQPTIVKKIVTARGELAPEARQFNYFEPVVADRNIVSTGAIASIVEALIGVTGDDGTGALAEMPGYTVAGKTGTAQKAVRGGYSRDCISSFVGFAPARKPALCVLVVLDAPQKTRYGGLVAAPVFRSICMEALAYLKVAKDKPEPILTQIAQAAVAPCN
ncbi:MAG: penicillin-binding protein 2 [bacterium]|nr:penicillin-binding protein 2 [bacterium]